MSVPKGEEPLALRTKLAFGVGTMAETISLAAIGSYAMFYYNQVLGLSATLAGLAITLGIFLDGVVDPFIGSLSDRTRSRLGRRHPYMFIAPIPVAISLFAVFHPPHALASVWLFAWFLAFVVSLRISSSVYHVPHLAVGGELSSDFTERTRVMSYSNLAGAIGVAGTSFVALTFFFAATPEYPRGILNPAGYGAFAMTAAAIVLIIQFTSAWFTRDRIAMMTPPAADQPKFTGLEFLKDVGRAFANRNYLFLLIAVFFFSLLVSLRTGLSLYLNTYFWGLASEQIRWFSLATFAGYLFSFFITARIHHRFGKRYAMATCAVLYGVIPGIPITLGMLGLMPGADSAFLVPILCLSTGLGASIGGVIAITALSAIGDIADENELKYGIRQEGVLYSTRTVFSKIDSAIGHLLVGIMLDVMQFPKGAKPESIDPHSLWNLGLVDGPLAIIPGVIAAFFYAGYAIDRRRYTETRRQLEAARAERKATTPAPATPPDLSQEAEATLIAT
jgi:GPH family glycoside/pentoside/hexuronide:cation symporter